MLFSFWSGPLTWVEHLCMKSMLDAGHSLTVYSYEKLNLPPGVFLGDASEIIPPRDRFGGHIAQYSDVFRYRALHRGLGTWVDLDHLMLHDMHDMGDMVFGFDTVSKPKVATGVLRLPPDSPVLTELLAFLNQPVIVPPWWKLRRKIRQRAAALIGKHKRPGQFGYSQLGPPAVTHFIAQAGLLSAAQPSDVFYPIGYKFTSRFFDPDDDVEASFTPRTRAVHLFNATLADRKRHPPPPGSFLARMCEKHGIHAGDPVFPPSGRASEALSTSIS